MHTALNVNIFRYIFMIFTPDATLHREKYVQKKFWGPIVRATASLSAFPFPPPETPLVCSLIHGFPCWGCDTHSHRKKLLRQRSDGRRSVRNACPKNEEVAFLGCRSHSTSVSASKNWDIRFPTCHEDAYEHSEPRSRVLFTRL